MHLIQKAYLNSYTKNLLSDFLYFSWVCLWWSIISLRIKRCLNYRKVSSAVKNTLFSFLYFTFNTMLQMINFYFFYTRQHLMITVTNVGKLWMRKSIFAVQDTHSHSYFFYSILIWYLFVMKNKSSAKFGYKTHQVSLFDKSLLSFSWINIGN